MCSVKGYKMNTFRKVEEFNKKFKNLIQISNLAIPIKSYDDLIKDPEKFCFTENSTFMSFIVKSRIDNLRLFSFFTVQDFGYEVIIRYSYISSCHLNFMNDVIASEGWNL